VRILIRPSARWPRASLPLARKRLEFALGRFAGHVQSLRVRLTDLNGPRGGLDKKCLIEVRLARPRRVVIVEDIDRDHAVAIGRAVERTSRAVARAIQSAADGRLMQRGY